MCLHQILTPPGRKGGNQNHWHCDLPHSAKQKMLNSSESKEQHARGTQERTFNCWRHRLIHRYQAIAKGGPNKIKIQQAFIWQRGIFFHVCQTKTEIKKEPREISMCYSTWRFVRSLLNLLSHIFQTKLNEDPGGESETKNRTPNSLATHINAQLP